MSSLGRTPSRGRTTSRYKVTPKVGSKSDHLPRKIYQSSRVIGGPAGITSPRRPYFDIHPEWKSESVTLQRLNIRDQKHSRPPITSGYNTYPPRRCKSAPPCISRGRNPITWDGFWTTSWGTIERFNTILEIVMLLSVYAFLVLYWKMLSLSEIFCILYSTVRHKIRYIILLTAQNCYNEAEFPKRYIVYSTH